MGCAQSRLTEDLERHSHQIQLIKENIKQAFIWSFFFRATQLKDNNVKMFEFSGKLFFIQTLFRRIFIFSKRINICTNVSIKYQYRYLCLRKLVQLRLCLLIELINLSWTRTWKQLWPRHKLRGGHLPLLVRHWIISGSLQPT